MLNVLHWLYGENESNDFEALHIFLGTFLLLTPTPLDLFQIKLAISRHTPTVHFCLIFSFGPKLFKQITSYLYQRELPHAFVKANRVIWLIYYLLTQCVLQRNRMLSDNSVLWVIKGMDGWAYAYKHPTVPHGFSKEKTSRAECSKGVTQLLFRLFISIEMRLGT